MRLSLAYSSTLAMRSMLRRYERWMRTKRAGSSVASTAASVWSLRYCFPSDLKRDVVVLRLDVVDPVDREHVDLRAVADQHALGRTRSAAARRATSASTSAAPPSRRSRSRARASASCEPLRAERLQQVVDGVHLERPQRVLVVRGDEDRPALVAPEQLEHLEAVQLRHLHVEQHQVGRQLGHRLDRLEAVAALGHDLDVRHARRGTRAPPPAPAARRPRSQSQQVAFAHAGSVVDAATRVPAATTPCASLLSTNASVP